MINRIVLFTVTITVYCHGESIFETMFESVVTDHRDVKVFQKEYDFIVIGAGSGGSVIASRLSDVYKWSVLLLEAGKYESPITDIPISASMLQITGYNWGYKSVPDRNYCLKLEGGVCNIPQGRAIGGTSVINFLIHTRGNRKDYDDWERLGNIGWGYDDVLPYFKKLERAKIPFADPKYRGLKGPVSVENAKFKTPLLQSFLEAGRMMGFNITDPNSSGQLGFSRAQATMLNGARCSAAKAYLNHKVRMRRNLSISPRTWVTKIVIDERTKRAIGVEFVKNKRLYFIKARKEVILSAGAIGSPRLLMLSGIGPADHLSSLNIPIIRDLKVGYNHQDHVYMPALTFLVNASITLSGREAQDPMNMLSYFVKGTGPLTLPGGAEAIGFIKTNYSTTAPDQPDIELVMGPGAVNNDEFGVMRRLAGFTDEFHRQYLGPILNLPAFSIVPVMLKPKSRGRVMLKSKNPFHWPKIQMNFFDHPDDLAVLIEGIQRAIELGESPPFQRFGTRFWKQKHPGCEQLPFNTPIYWECAIRNYASSLHHHSGTCKMGPSYDRDSVVDSNLIIHGLQNLRVVDASVIPIIPASHTNSVVFMIAEKTADTIKTYWFNEFHKSKNRNESFYDSENYL